MSAPPSTTASQPLLPAWNPRRYWEPHLQDGRLTVVVGRHGSGKSTLCRYLLPFIDQNTPDWVAYCGSMGAVQTVQGLIPRPFQCRREPTAADVQRLIERQEIETDLAATEGRPVRPLGVLIDDCSGARSIFYSVHSPLLRLVKNMRHLRIHLVLTAQSPREFCQQLLEQVDFLFLFGIREPQAQQLLYRKFFKGGMGTAPGIHYGHRDYDRFVQHMRTYASRPGQCLVLDNVAPLIQYAEYPRDPRTFLLGDRQYLETARAMGRPGGERANPNERYRRAMQRLTQGQA